MQYKLNFGLIEEGETRCAGFAQIIINYNTTTALLQGSHDSCLL